MIKHFDTDKKLRTKVIRKHRSKHPKWRKASIVMIIILIITILLAAIASYYFEINSFGFNGEIDKIMLLTVTLVFTILFSVPNLFYYRHMRFKVCNNDVDSTFFDEVIFDNDIFKYTYYDKEYDRYSLCRGCEIEYRKIIKITYNPKSFELKVYGTFYNVDYNDRATGEVKRKNKCKSSESFNIYMYYYENEEIMRLLEDKTNKKIEITDEW
ncbi:hypothetical protein [Clostridium tertium]